MSSKQDGEGNPRDAGRDLDRIGRIVVSGFKSLAQEQSVEVRPLTILAGANSSGKSSVMQPLLLMKQTLEAGYDPGALLLDGPNLRFTSAAQLFARSGPSKKADAFRVGFNIEGQGEIVSEFVR